MNFKKLEMYLRVNLLGPGRSSYKKIIYRAAVSQRLGNTGVASHNASVLSAMLLHPEISYSKLTVTDFRIAIPKTKPVLNMWTLLVKTDYGSFRRNAFQVD
jgi:hypothetical protein